MDNAKLIPFEKYHDSKLLCTVFMYNLAQRIQKDRVLMNMLCPGMVTTTMSNVLSVYLGLPVSLIKAIRARRVKEGGWLILNGVIVAGPESNGTFLQDKDI